MGGRMIKKLSGSQIEIKGLKYQEAAKEQYVIDYLV